MSHLKVTEHSLSLNTNWKLKIELGFVNQQENMRTLENASHMNTNSLQLTQYLRRDKIRGFIRSIQFIS
jgi:hypothetical protein